VFEARDKNGISFNEIAVLAAIYSKIGATSNPVRITQREIWYRAHGFKSQRVFHREMERQIPSITLRHIRTVIESLHQRGFFARITFARRQTYYSHRLTADQLAEAIFQLRTRAAKTRCARIQANNDLTFRIQAERRRLAGSGPAT
jgi:hypothetical protein